MRRLGRVLVAVMLAGTVLAVAGWIAWYPLVDAVRDRLEPLLASALHMPVRIGSARVALRPLRIDIGDLSLGDLSLGEGGTVLRMGSGRLTIRLMESLRRGQPVGDLEAHDVEVAPLGFATHANEHKPPRRPLPLFSVRRIRIENARVLIPTSDGPVVVTAQHLGGRFAVAEGDHLQTTLRARSLQVKRNDRELSVDTVRGKVDYAAGHLVIPACVLAGPEITLHGRYDRAVRGHRVWATLDAAALALIDPRLQQIRGHVAVDGTFFDPWKDLLIQARVRAPQLVAFDQEVTDFDGTMHLRGKELELTAGHATHETGTYAVSGTLSLTEPIAFTLQSDWQHRLEAPPETGAKIVPPLLASAHASARGSLKPVRIDGDLTGEVARSAAGDDRVRVSATGSYTAGAARVQANATQTSGNEVTVGLSMDRSGTLTGTARTRVADVPAWQSLLGLPVTRQLHGVLNIDARIGGTRDRPRIEGGIHGRNVTLFDTTLTSVDAEVRSDTDQLELLRMTTRLTRGSITADGIFGLRAHVANDWRIAVADVPTQSAAALLHAATGVALPLWGGQLNLQASGGGDWSAVAGRARLRLDDFYLQREPIAHVAIAVDSAWPQWSADGRLEHGPDERLSVVLNGTGLASMSASVQSSSWDLRRVRTANRLGLSGNVELNATAQGPPAAMTGHLHCAGEGIEWSGRSLGEVRLEAGGRAGNWQLEGQVGDRITATGTLETRNDLPVRATVDWRDADLAPLIRPDPNVRIESSGSLRLQVPLRDLQRIDGTLQVDRLDVIGTEQGAPLVSVASPILVVATSGKFELRSFHLGGTGTDIVANGWFNTDAQCDIGVDAHSDLALVEVMSPAVYAARGSVTMTGRMRKLPNTPLQLEGNAKLERVAFDLGPPWVAVNVNGEMSFRDSLAQIDTLTGRLAGGTFAVGGIVDVAQGPALTWSATEVAPVLLPDLETEVSGQGALQGSWSDMTLSGEIEVLRGLYDRRFALTDLIPLFQDRLAKPRSKEPAQAIVRLGLHVVAADELYIDNNVAKIELRSDLRLTGTADDVVIAGPVDVLNGEVKFRGRTFTLTTGIVEFRPELGRQAYLNINAQTVIPAARATYTVDTHIVGTTNDYRVTFTSDDPTLSQTDLVSLVTFGKTVAELQEGGGGVSVTDLIALAPGLYKEQAQERAQSLLGIDRVELEPGYSKSTGLYEPRVMLGKSLTPDLSAALSSTFGIQRRQSVQLEYRVSPRISLLGEWESASPDQAGAFAGEVKFRYPFRTFPGWAALLPWPGEDVQ